MQCNSAKWIIHTYFTNTKERNKGADKKFEAEMKKNPDFSAHKCYKAAVLVNVYLLCKTSRLQWTRREVIKIKLMECCYSWVRGALMTRPGLTLTPNVQTESKQLFHLQDRSQMEERRCRAAWASSADPLGLTPGVPSVYTSEHRQIFNQRHISWGAERPVWTL